MNNGAEDDDVWDEAVIAQIDDELKELDKKEEARIQQARIDNIRRTELHERLFRLQVKRPSQAIKAQVTNFDSSTPNNNAGEVGTLFGLDIGGSLAKLVFFEPNNSPTTLQAISQFINASEHYGTTGKRLSRLSFAYKDGTFHFIQFETRRMVNAIDLMVNNNLHSGMTKLSATGGGAFKFAAMMKEKTNILFEAHGELESMVRGLVFLINHSPSELYLFTGTENLSNRDKMTIVPATIRCEDMYPFIVVNIGSGVSILQVMSPGTFERVSGTALGGGTYLGLCRLLLKCSTFEQALGLAEEGHSSKIDLLVSDIYGGKCEEIGLPPQATAACFGKMVNADMRREDTTDADLARALLTMLSNNIGQIAYLVARERKAKHIIFAGSFLRHNDIAQRTLAYATAFWSQGAISALFLNHEGFCGAVGALLHTIPFGSVETRRERSVSLIT
eukprot:c5071_g1_i2.p1 GENE.c5071_g1_i2~~c5071_g1_i2.p1  ORF type:complete len:493 (+),score=119.90 c5071_g1_i2:140-1480(+)